MLIDLDPKDSLSQVVPIGDAGLRASGIYRNKQTDDVLYGAALDVYLGKRARKGKQLDVRPKQPVLSPVL